MLLFLLFFLNGQASAQIAVSFQEKVEVTGSRIVLGDIAVITPKGSEAEAVGQLPVGLAPQPGASKVLRTISVITALQRKPEVAQVDWQGSETITVERKGQRLSQDQLKKILEEYLQQNSEKLAQGSIELESFRAPETVNLPLGTLGWKITPSRPNIMSSSSFSIQFTVDEQPVSTCVVYAKITAYAEVVTAKTTLHKGDVVTEESVVLEKQRIDRLQNPVMTIDEILGMQVAKTINAGNGVEHGQITSPAVIKEGDQVKIFARRGALNISTSGIARTDGRLGETIQVKNTGSNKIIRCRVDGPGLVSVEF